MPFLFNTPIHFNPLYKDQIQQPLLRRLDLIPSILFIIKKATLYKVSIFTQLTQTSFEFIICIDYIVDNSDTKKAG